MSREPPHGASVIVRSLAPQGWRYLVLRRAHHGPDFEGDWAWTPPAGARFPGEAVAVGAARELEEETGLRASPAPVRLDSVDWAVFDLVVPWETGVVLDSEHDRCQWLSLEEACLRCHPSIVQDQIRLAAGRKADW